MAYGAYSDLCTSETRAGIQTDTIPTGTAIHLNLPCIRLETSSSIFSGNTTLDRESTFGDRVLAEAQLR